MKKTIKKIAAVLFAVVIAVACFAGCSNRAASTTR